MARKGTQTTDFSEISLRINGMLDFDQIGNEEDYRRSVRDLVKNNPQGRDSGTGANRATNLLGIVDDLFRQNDTTERITKNEVAKVRESEDAFRSALRFERRRKLKERLRDESRTAKNTKPATKGSVRQWKRHPTMMDIKSVDTKRLRRRGIVSILTKTKEAELRGKGVAVTYDILSRRHFRDIRTGRFARIRL